VVQKSGSDDLKKMNDEGPVDNDWRTAERLLFCSDNVNDFAKLVRTHHIHAHGASGRTLLHWACRLGRMRCVAWLLQNGADAELRDTSNLTPLHLAAANCNAGCVALLLRHGAYVDPVSVSVGRWTPLSDAVDQGYEQTARLLLDAGASVELAREKTEEDLEIPPWVDDFLRARKACAKAVIAFVGSSDRQHRDVARLVGKMIWNTRGAADWEDASTRTKRSK